MLRISIIIPTWNEERELSACLASIGPLSASVEVIVCDATSTDRTREIATAQGARVLPSPIRQRGAQLNLAAREAQGDMLLFLHADTHLPAEWFQEMQALFSRHPQIVGGAFRRQFDHPSRWLRCTCWLADWRGRIWGTFLGDQAMFVRASDFRRLGGFQNLAQCEDLELSLRMAKAGRTRMIKRPVLTSGRRFIQHGPVRQTWRDFLIAARFIKNHSKAPDLRGDLETTT